MNNPNELNQQIFPIEILLKIMKIGKVYKMALLSRIFYQEAINYFKQCKGCKSIILPIIGYTNCLCSWYCNKCIANDCLNMSAAQNGIYELFCSLRKCSTCHKNMCSLCGEKESLNPDNNNLICNICFENELPQTNCLYPDCSLKIETKCRRCQNCVCQNHIIDNNNGCYNCQRCNVIGCNNMNLCGICSHCTKQYCIDHIVCKSEDRHERFGCCNCKLHCKKCGILPLTFKKLDNAYYPLIICDNCLDICEQFDFSELLFHEDPGYSQ